jgi:hypothetical protein
MCFVWLFEQEKHFPNIVNCLVFLTPVTVAALSAARNVFARSNAGIVGSNPTQGMDEHVCVRLFCVRVLCVGSGLATG